MIISSPSHKLSDVERRGAFGYGACKQEVMSCNPVGALEILRLSILITCENCPSTLHGLSNCEFVLAPFSK